jgi:hypothetical protein
MLMNSSKLTLTPVGDNQLLISLEELDSTIPAICHSKEQLTTSARTEVPGSVDTAGLRPTAPPVELLSLKELDTATKKLLPSTTLLLRKAKL